MGDRAAKLAMLSEFARVGSALGSGHRLEILDLLAQGEHSVDAIARAARLPLTTASAHLKTLREADLVVTRREGTRIFYSLADTDVAELLALVRIVAIRHRPAARVARDNYLGTEPEQVSREELLRRVDAGEVIVVDVRPAAEYQAGHIPGAVSIPIEQLAARLAELPADREIVAYCRGRFCVFAHEAVRLLNGRGRAARRLEAGMLEWRLAGFPVAS
jgi:rhodanese-related sulfurtransferase/DNA-binding transcriptional ArsR family regulator